MEAFFGGLDLAAGVDWDRGKGGGSGSGRGGFGEATDFVELFVGEDGVCWGWC